MFKELSIVLIGVGAGVAASMVVFSRIKLFDFDKKRKQAEDVLSKAKEEADMLKKEALKRGEENRRRAEEENIKREERVKKLTEGLKNKETYIEKKDLRNNDLRLEIVTNEEKAQFQKEQIKKAGEETEERLKKKTGLNKDSLRKEVVESYCREIEEYGNDRLAKLEEDVKENANRSAKKILQVAMQRLSSPTSVESRTVYVKVPKDFIKGKIVGRNAENIIKIESLTEADIVFNELPNTISISYYNLVVRRIAQIAIEKLVAYRGNIDAKVVEKSFADAKKDIEKELYEVGKRALDKLGVKIENKELVQIIGRMQYRTSYGQNIMKHSMEVAWVATIIAYELGIDTKTAKIGGFLHDLGKAIDQDPGVEETHDRLTKQLMEKYGFTPEEVHAAWTHHEAEPPKTPEAWTVIAADAISASRPGARQESLGQYIDRMQALEEKGQAFEGVKKAFAISAGRELRVMVDPEMIVDGSMKKLADDIAAKIESELSYPGKVKVNVIRRTVTIEMAK